MDYKLIVPIKKVDGTEIDHVTVRESYTGRDVRTVCNSKGEGDAQVRLVMCATGLSENNVDNMDARDVNAISKMAKPFFATGEA